MIKIVFLLIIAIVLPLLTACQDISESSSVVEVETSRIGIMAGSIAEVYSEINYPQAELHLFNNYADSVAALFGHKLDYAFINYVSAINFIRHNPELEIVPDVSMDGPIQFAVSMKNPELHRQISEIIDRYMADGTMDEITSRWIITDGRDYVTADIPYHENAPVLRMAIVSSIEPLTFMLDGRYAGMDIELMQRVAYELGYRIEFLDMQWSGVISALESGRADISLGMYYTQERSERILFTPPYLDDPYVLVGRKPYAIADEAVSQSFLESIITGFERNLIREGRWKLIVEGLQVSLIISIFSFALATLLGFAVCGLRMSKNRVLSAIGRLYITVLRGTPIVVLLMIAFYVIFAGSRISGIAVAVITFGANGAAFIGEIIRSAILTIDKGQVEAARSMGFSKAGAFFTVTLPQAVRAAFPVYMSEFISLFKMTSVVGYIAIVDLTKAGDIIRSRTYDAFFPLIMVALVYLIVASVLVWFFNMIYKKTNKRLRRAK